ncbi:hypothetical protein BCR37DRAFT_335562, partial [Protomyces lactucae-debilis]
MSSQSALSLYRQILRSAQPLPYNFRMYTKRRAGDAFREARQLQDATQIATAKDHALEQLKMVRRQATMHAMFHTDPLVVE